jgi:hypothetical protein
VFPVNVTGIMKKELSQMEQLFRLIFWNILEGRHDKS